MNQAPKDFALIIGAAKAGTSSLFTYLASHPQVAPCREKEPNFLVQKMDEPCSIDAYRQLWDWDSAIHRVALEGSTSYTKQPNTPAPTARIKAMDGCRFRFIYIMRNPMKRIESHRIHLMDGKWENSPDDPRQITEHQIDLTRYAMQLDAYFREFDSDDILLLCFEDMIADPRATAKRVFDFLDVDPTFDIPLIEPANTRKQRADAPLVRRLRRWPMVRTIGRLLPMSARQEIKSSMRDRLQRRMVISEDERSMIIETLHDDLVRLRDVYGIDASEKWGIAL